MRGKHGRWVMAGIAALLLIWMVWGNRTVGVTNYIVSSDKLPEAFVTTKLPLFLMCIMQSMGKTTGS